MTAVWAHRGASAAEPENTVAAFAAAAAMGADGVELDVRATADGVLAVHHDPHLADGRALAELVAADLPSFVPTLAAALEACGDLVVNVELKDLPGEPGHGARPPLADRTVAALAGLPAARRARLLVSSFDMAALDRVRDLDPSLATGFLALVPSGELAERLVERCARRGHGAFHPHHTGVDAGLVRRCHDAGIAVHPWTVDDPARLRELAALGVDAVITNRPDLARAALDLAEPDEPDETGGS